MLRIDDVTVTENASDAERAEVRTGRARVFREETRDARVVIAREAEPDGRPDVRSGRHWLAWRP